MTILGDTFGFSVESIQNMYMDAKPQIGSYNRSSGVLSFYLATLELGIGVEPSIDSFNIIIENIISTGNATSKDSLMFEAEIAKASALLWRAEVSAVSTKIKWPKWATVVLADVIGGAVGYLFGGPVGAVIVGAAASMEAAQEGFSG